MKLRNSHRRFTRSLVTVLSVPLLTCSAGAAPMPKLNASVSPTSATIGQPITVLVTADVAELSRLTLTNPFDGRMATSWTLVGKPVIEDETAGGGLWRRKMTYKIAAFDLGDIEAPTFAATYALPDGTSAETSAPPVLVTIHSVLGPDEKVALRDIRPPYELPYPRWIVILAASLGVLVLLMILWLMYRKLWGRVGQLIRPTKRIDAWALDQLDKIEREKLLEHKKFKEYYTRLTDVVRTFLGKTWNFQALDMTSGELHFYLENVEQDERPDDKETFTTARQRVLTLFDDADLVKFARTVPDAGHARQDLDRAREIVRLMRYKLEPARDEQKPNAQGTSTVAPPPTPSGTPQSEQRMARS